ncbi:septum site-determining protein MinC [Alkalicoccobacillus plakortidis]|uniref:Probable septum site-determining protein MinC n=1 Tax=Alkalicoccobacillus plakortidis TaxID=444060 RepID=A0ABT0XIY0_9BACI|nr:septum site-determining protein MinC [Alkalicoccobacillus plakortidis]MCM2675164.1 septum site-determining protein MinC [Alkalicoccobacillus plakortidis]
MTQKKQHVTIKGKKDGLVFLLDEHCAYDCLITELTEKLNSNYYQHKEGPNVRVRVDVGRRFLSEESEAELRQVITEGRALEIEAIESTVISVEEAERRQQESQFLTLTRFVRSGQVLKVRGDVLLVGDINPGGTLMATGSIHVLGALKGIAHAGYEGNRKAVITASLMAPVQLRIASEIYSFADIDHEDTFMETAFLKGATSEFVLERVQKLVHERPELTSNTSQLIEE